MLEQSDWRGCRYSVPGRAQGQVGRDAGQPDLVLDLAIGRGFGN